MVLTGLALVALVLAVLSTAMEPGNRWSLMFKIAVILLALTHLIGPYV